MSERSSRNDGPKLFGLDRYCPHTYRITKTPCSAWDRRLPKTEELTNQLDVNGVELQADATVRVEPLASMTLSFKRELLAVLPIEDQRWRFKSCALVGAVYQRCEYHLPSDP